MFNFGRVNAMYKPFEGQFFYFIIQFVRFTFFSFE